MINFLNNYFYNYKLICLTFVVAIVISIAGYYKFVTHHTSLPVGCDEFGYLQLADYISNGNVLNDHNHFPFLNDLSSHLKDTGIKYKDYAWLITPHCHHIDKYSGKKINQYPLGTSVVLSFFSKEIRPQMFPILVFLLFLIPAYISLLVLKFEKEQILKSLIFLIAIVIYGSFNNPFEWHLTHVNSVAVTFGILFSSGILIRKRPVIAVFLIALSINFRLANIILLPVAFLFYIDFKKDKPTRTLFKLSKLSIIALVSGPLLYLVYVYNLTGRFFHTTYSAIDQVAKSNIGLLSSNFNFYVNLKSDWFLVQLIALIFLFIFFAKKWVTAKELILVLSMVFINYIFYLFHNVAQDYYPYATSIVIFGFIFLILANKIPSFITFEKYTLNILIIILVVAGLYYKLDQPKSNDYVSTYKSEAKKYEKCFGDYDVVWSEFRSGTVEYVTDTAGFRLRWGTEESIVETMKWLIKNQLRQVLWITDLNTGDFPIKVSETMLKKLLDGNKFKYSKHECEDLGEMITISN